MGVRVVSWTGEETASPMRSKGWQSQLLILVAYTLLALLLTWPMASKFSTHVPGDGADDPPLTWNLWWVRHALLEEGTNPFDSDYLFYPLGINLAFYTLTVLNGLLSIPLQLTVGLIPASNLILLSSFALSGYGAFLLASYTLSAAKPARQVFEMAVRAGGASAEQIKNAFRILTSDDQTHAVLINIFGGILRCDVLARGVIAAAEKVKIPVPLIVRLEGTNVSEGRKILQESGLEFLVARDLTEAAALVTAQVSEKISS